MKQYKVFLQTANDRILYEIVSAEDSTLEKINEAREKSISIAETVLSRYKEEPVYCFVYVYDNEYNIIYENDNISYKKETAGDQITLDDLVKNNNVCSCILAEGYTKERERKFIRYKTKLGEDGSVKTLFEVYACDVCMLCSTKIKIMRHLGSAITYYNSL